MSVMSRFHHSTRLALAVTTALAAAGAQAQTQVRYCAALGSGMPVPEAGPGLDLFFQVPASGNIVDVDVEFASTHPHTGDLTVLLMKGTNTLVWLIDHSMGSPPNDIGCQGSLPDLIFDDEGTNGNAQDVCQQSGSAFVPAGGRFRPMQPLSAFDNIVAQGQYQVHVDDPYPGDPGNLTHLCLVMTTTLAPDRIFANGFQ
jgi:hypothetical protein